MERSDVLIVGGGPAGSSCAWGLRDSGLKVAVVDKQPFPRDKTCGGWITPEVLAMLQIEPAAYGQGRTLQPITGFRVGLIGEAGWEKHYHGTVSYGIRRREFDEYLLRRSGAELMPGTPYTPQMRAPMVVGAGGHFCPVARRLNSGEAEEGAVVAQEVEFAMDTGEKAECQVRGDTPELYFCRDMKGYGWCFRKGDFLNVGLGRADPHGLPAHVSEFVWFLRQTGRIGFDLPRMHGHAYLLKGTSRRRVVDDGVLLVGDAAGLACTQSGEGIRPAVESGLLAARIITAADPVYTAERLDRYRAELAIGKQSWALRMGRFLPAGLIEQAAQVLFRSRWLAGRVVLDHWFLGGEKISNRVSA